MLQIINQYPDYQFVIAGAPSFAIENYSPLIVGLDVKVIFNQTYNLLKHSYAAIVTSGTATLETALFNIPQVVVYKMIQFQYDIGKFFIKVKFFSLVNIILDKVVVNELLQNDLAVKIKMELDKVLSDNSYRKQMLENYKLLQNILGDTGASKRTAEQIVKDLRE